MPNITPLGKRWENLRSFWLLWLLVFTRNGYLSFISFFYIGIRARKWKWILSGFGYLAIVLFFYTTKQLMSKEVIDEEHYLFDIALLLYLSSYITIWVHAFWARKEYLQIMADRYIEKREKELEEQVATEVDQEAAKKVNVAFHEAEMPSNIDQQLISINTSSEKEIAHVTGKDVAKEIVTARNKGTVFRNVLDIIRVVDMKPHILAKCKKQFDFTIPADKVDREDKDNKRKRMQGRKVDI